MFSRRIYFMALAVVALLSAPAYAGPHIRATEEAIETNTSSVTLPVSGTGSILRLDCQRCNDSPLQITSDSKFFIGKTAVSFADLTAALKQSKDSHAVTIFYGIGTRTITRVLVD